MGPRRLRVDNHSKRIGDLIQPIFVGDQHAVDRLDGREILLSQRFPEARVCSERAEGVNERGIEPVPAAPDRQPVDRADAARPMKHLDGLRQAQDAARERDLRPA